MAEDSMILTVTNVAPTLVLTGAAVVEEGSPYLLTLGPVIDPGGDSVSQYIIHWGDGITDALTAASVAALNRQVTHTYADGTTGRAITVDLVDSDGTYVAAGSLLVTVQNVAPLIAGVTRSVTTLDENGFLTVTGAFTDPGTLDAHTVRINWGDGSALQTLLTAVGIT